ELDPSRSRVGHRVGPGARPVINAGGLPVGFGEVLENYTGKRETALLEVRDLDELTRRADLRALRVAYRNTILICAGLLYRKGEMVNKTVVDQFGKARVLNLERVGLGQLIDYLAVVAEAHRQHVED